MRFFLGFAAFVGMVLEGELAVGFFDGLGGGIAGQGEEFVDVG